MNGSETFPGFVKINLKLPVTRYKTHRQTQKLLVWNWNSNNRPIYFVNKTGNKTRAGKYNKGPCLSLKGCK